MRGTDRPVHPGKQDKCRGGHKRKTKTHKDQGGIQILIVLPHKVTVILVGFTLEFVVEFDASAARGSKEIWKEGRKCLEDRIL